MLKQIIEYFKHNKFSLPFLVLAIVFTIVGVWKQEYTYFVLSIVFFILSGTIYTPPSKK
jgi:hypothetical membrane protein